MRQSRRFLATAAFMAAGVFALATPRDSSGEVIETTLPAPSLGTGSFNNSADQPIAVYVPPSYSTTALHYPVVYFLHGYSTPLTGFLDGRFQGLRLGISMDQLISSGQIQEMIVVLPNARGFMLGTFYVDSPVHGAWESYLVNDVVPWVDANYRTLARPSSRGAGGHSMGGFGALHLAMRHPDVFGAAYALSPGLFDADGLSESFMFDDDAVIEQYLSQQAHLDTLSPAEAHAAFVDLVNHLRDINDTHRLFSYSYGAAFSHNLDQNAPYIDYPYSRDDPNLVRDADVWARWDNGFGNWEHKVGLYRDNLLGLLGLVIDYGTNDSYAWIPEGCVHLAGILLTQGVPHELRSFSGGHSNLLKWRMITSVLPYFSDVLEGGSVPVAVQSYDARWADGCVVVEWRLLDLSGVPSFEVHREEVPGGMPVWIRDATVLRRGSEFCLEDHSVARGKTYRYRVVIAEDGEAVTSFVASVSTPRAGLALGQNHPNPFNPASEIEFSIDRASRVTLAVYDTAGRRVRTLVDGTLGRGDHTARWDGRSDNGRSVTSGVYFLVLDSDGRKLRRKAVLLR